MLFIPKPDGFTDGFTTIQGVRTYDSQSGQWTTPDAYHADVRDPFSQKPYTWNRNNPLAYLDAKGCRSRFCRYKPHRTYGHLAEAVGNAVGSNRVNEAK